MFRRPLGLVLGGGGAHGAWQAGCLQTLVDAGLSFDRVLGISVGSLTGVAYAIGQLQRALDFWRDIDAFNVMRLEPRLAPFSLFSDAAIRDALKHVGTEEEAKARVRCEFTAVTLCRDTGLHHYARFTPQGSSGWDGPIADKIRASCAVPYVFPPVRLPLEGRVRTFVDGGAVSGKWATWDHLAGCKDVLVIQLFRPEEVGGVQLFKRLRGDPLGRDCEHAVRSLKELPDPPRVFRFYPSSRLSYSQFSFRRTDTIPAIERGLGDGKSLLSFAQAFQV